MMSISPSCLKRGYRFAILKLFCIWMRERFRCKKPLWGQRHRSQFHPKCGSKKTTQTLVCCSSADEIRPLTSSISRAFRCQSWGLSCHATAMDKLPNKKTFWQPRFRSWYRVVPRNQMNLRTEFVYLIQPRKSRAAYLAQGAFPETMPKYAASVKQATASNTVAVTGAQTSSICFSSQYIVLWLWQCMWAVRLAGMYPKSYCTARVDSLFCFLGYFGNPALF